nr:helix-turn-helix domain-containing protein [uncultured Aminipila sp.]
MLSMTRYSIKTQCLAPWIKFIWHFEVEDADIHYKLLPTDCIDIVLNMSGDIVYEADSHCIFATPFHINGLRSKHSYIHQTGNIRVFGISCYPFGLYPFINKSLAGIHDEIVDLFELSMSLARKLELAVSNQMTTENIIENIEKALCLELQVSDDYVNKANLIHEFLETGNDSTIQSFCLEHGINTKTFMRNVLYYTGYTPKTLLSIRRFQKSGNQLIYQQSKQLSRIAYDNDFADQAHFIREFRKFSGTAPRTFEQEKITLKENTKYNYR